jgi:hypothetical protein
MIKDLLKQEKTCSTRLMTKSQLHKLIIPSVPDRGGRTGELQPPPPEMPAFMQRQNQPQTQRQGRGGQNNYNQDGQSGRGHHNDNKWFNEQTYRHQSDFERFQNQNYHGGDGGNRGGNNHYGQGGRGGGRGGYTGGGSRNRY